MINDVFERVKSIGFHGAIGIAVVLAVVFGYVYGVVNQPDHDLTQTASTVLVAGVGSLLAAAVFMLKGDSE